MKYILIIIILNSFRVGAATTAEFDSRDACFEAGAALIHDNQGQQDVGTSVSVNCFAKGSPLK